MNPCVGRQLIRHDLVTQTGYVHATGFTGDPYGGHREDLPCRLSSNRQTRGILKSLAT